MEPTGSVIDEINNPPHYTKGGIEPADYIEANDLDFFEGNVVKYVTRYPHKGTPLKDLHKARFYLERIIRRTEIEIELQQRQKEEI